MIKTKYAYKDGKAVCTLLAPDNLIFVGKAYCHPEDKDMATEYTGLRIAEDRANMKYLSYLIKESKKELHTLQTFFNTLKNRPSYSDESKEVQILIKDIRRRKRDIEENEAVLKNMEERLNEYLNTKDEFYKRIRANRDKGQK